MATQRRTVTDNDQFLFGAGKGYVRAADVAQEADFSLRIRTHQTDINNIPLPTLKGIYRVDGKLWLVGFKYFLSLVARSELTHLGFIRSNNADGGFFLRQIFRGPV